MGFPGGASGKELSCQCRRHKRGEFAQSCLTLCDPRTVAHKAPLSMGFFRQGYWSKLPFPPPGDLSDPGIEPRSPALQVDSLPLHCKVLLNVRCSTIYSRQNMEGT